METFRLWGYQQIMTPLFERAEVLERGLGPESETTSIRFIEPSGELVALRPDITPQIARIAATRMADVGGAIRLCYEGTIVRGGSGARGQRELLQAGVELIDAEGVDVDSELLCLAATSLAQSCVAERSLDVGHVVLTRFALSAVEDEALQQTLQGLLRRKDRLGIARAAHALPAELRDILETLPILFGAPDDVLHRARGLKLPSQVHAVLDELEATLAATHTRSEGQGALSALLGDLTLDLGELRGFDYYTGMRVSAFAKGAGGPVLRGGRYNHLVEKYGRQASATGFAVDIEALAQVESLVDVRPEEDGSGVLVISAENNAQTINRVVQALRSKGLRVAKHVGKNNTDEELLAYAKRVGFAGLLCWNGDDVYYLDSRCQKYNISNACIERAARLETESLIKIVGREP